MGRQNISISTDNVIFLRKKEGTSILLVKRKADPYQGKWALPGGFLEEMEPLEDGAKRELKEETGLEVEKLHQIKAFGAPHRDPRGRTITIAFWGEISSEGNIKGNDDAAEARWFSLEHLPEPAFDHKVIIEEALKHFQIEKA